MKAAVFVGSVVGASALVSNGNHKNGGFLDKSREEMRPDATAGLLSRVDAEWASQATSFLECTQSGEAGVHCDLPEKAFIKSCRTVTASLVQGSDGERDRVVEYMTRVCQEPSIGEHRSHCERLSGLMAHGMKADNYVNRESFNSEAPCVTLWQNVLDDEKALLEKRHKEEDAALAVQKKADEEAAKKAEADKKDEDARVAAAAKKAEEAAKIEKVATAAAKKAEEAAKSAEQESAKKEVKAKAKTSAKVESKPAPVAAKVHSSASASNATSNATK